MIGIISFTCEECGAIKLDAKSLANRLHSAEIDEYEEDDKGKRENRTVPFPTFLLTALSEEHIFRISIYSLIVLSLRNFAFNRRADKP